MNFRLAGYSDTKAIIEFDHVAQSDRVRVNFIHQAVSSRNCYVAVTDDLVVAYGVLDYSFFGHGFVSILYVKPNYRRQGVGTYLIRHMERSCNTKKLFATVPETNTEMQALLEKAGFQPSGTLENLKEDRELVYYMRRRRYDDED